VEFRNRAWGYDPKQVDRYVGELRREYISLTEQYSALETEKQRLEETLKAQPDPSAVSRAIVDAQTVAKQVADKARAEAEKDRGEDVEKNADMGAAGADAELIRRYRTWLLARGKVKSTAGLYAYMAAGAAELAGGVKRLTAATEEELLAVGEKWRAARKTPYSKWRMVMRSFFGFLRAEGLRTDNPMEAEPRPESELPRQYGSWLCAQGRTAYVVREYVRFARVTAELAGGWDALSALAREALPALRERWQSEYMTPVVMWRTAMRSFFRFLCAEGLRTDDPMEPESEPELLRRYKSWLRARGRTEPVVLRYARFAQAGAKLAGGWEALLALTREELPALREQWQSAYMTPVSMWESAARSFFRFLCAEGLRKDLPMDCPELRRAPSPAISRPPQ
jgi:site-specific recombinase XerD